MSDAVEVLLPCPFCGGADLSVRTHDVQPDDCYGGYVTCVMCDAQGAGAICANGWLHSPEEAQVAAIAAWNTRIAAERRVPADDDLTAVYLKGRADGRDDALPPGWVAVKREPSEAMLAAGAETSSAGYFAAEGGFTADELRQADVRSCWSAMIAAAEQEKRG